MKLAVLSDVHGNLLFFEKCLEAIEGESVDKIIALGDYFGYMLDGQVVLDILRSHKAVLLKGNHEAMLTGEFPLDKKKDKLYQLASTKTTLSKEYLNFIRVLPEKYDLYSNKIKMLFIHGCPNDPIFGYLYEDDMEKALMQNVNGYDYVFMGHTHRPYIKKFSKATFINVGSCGLPRDCGLSPSFCLFDTISQKIRMVRINIQEDVLQYNVYQKLDRRVFNNFLRRE